jgi:acylphosphatase
MPTLSLHITGKVQSVYYRQSTRKKALSLGLSGFVQNLPDGSVYIRVTGLRSLLDELITWCRTGPPAAVVNELVITELSVEEFDGFEIRR